MPLSRLCVDGHQLKTKPVTVYWVWYRSLNQRVCYRAYYCRDHIEPVMAFIRAGISYLGDEDGLEVFNCMSCGAGLDVITKFVYATFYIPGHEDERGEWHLCEPCFLTATSRFATEGQLMRERPDPGLGKGNSWDSWDQIGIQPKPTKTR